MFKGHKRKFPFLATLLAIFLLGSAAHADTTISTPQTTQVGNGSTVDNVLITSSGSIDVSATSNAFGMSLGQGSSVTNHGSVTSSSTPSALTSAILLPGTNNTTAWGLITNYGSITGYMAVYSPRVVNYGTITGVGTLSGNPSVGLVSLNTVTNGSPSLTLLDREVSLYNAGTISGGLMGAQVSGSMGLATSGSTILGFNALGRQGVFTNTSSGVVQSNGMGMLIQNTMATNAGSIRSGGMAVTLDMASTLENTGRIEGNVSALKPATSTGTFAVNLTQSPSPTLQMLTNTLINRVSGVIVGNVGRDLGISSLSGTRDANNVILNQGRIEGSILMGDGNDTVTLEGGSTVTGSVDGGGGTNVLNLDANANVGGTITHFQTVNATGSGPVTLSGNVNVGSLNLSNGGSNALSGNVTGNISVASSNLNITGTLTGNLTNSSGTTKVNGSVNGDVTVQGANAVLGGSGTITGQLNVNQGTLSPGNSPGTLTIVGPATLAAGTTYLAEVTPEGISDRLVTTGTTTINGAQLRVSPSVGYYRTGQFFNIVSAGGGVIGSFGSVESTVYSPVLRFVPVYGASDVNLVVLRNSYSSFAANSRQAAAGRGLDAAAYSAFGDGAAMFTALDWSTPGQINASLATMTPEPYQNYAEVLMSGRSMMRSTLGDRFTSTGSGPFSSMSMASGSFLPSVSTAQADKAASDAGNPLEPSRTSPFSIFLRPLGSFANQNGTSNRTGYNSGTWGMLAGGDWFACENFSFGPHIAYMSSRLKTRQATSGNGSVESGVAGLHGSFTSGPLRVDASTDLGIDGYQTSFNRQVPGYSRKASASFGGTSYSAFLGSSYDFTFGDFKVGPVASLEYASVHQAGFTEKGAGSSGLKVSGRTTDSLKSDIGLQAGYTHALSAIKLSYDVRGQWAHEYLQDNDTISASFRGIANSGFSTKLTERGRDSLLASAGVNAALNNRFGLNARYTGEFFRQGYDAHTIAAGFDYNF